MASVDIVSLDPKIEEFNLPAGTVCHRNGIPFCLSTDTLIRCHGANWPLIQRPSSIEAVVQLLHPED